MPRRSASILALRVPAVTARSLKPTSGDQQEIDFKYLSSDKALAITAVYFGITQENRISDGLTPGGVEQISVVMDGYE